MSQFSGKCDFCDTLWIHGKDEKGIEEFLKNTVIKVRTKDGRAHTCRVNTIKDAIKYLPYTTTIAFFSQGRGVIILSGTSYIDEEEQEHLQYDIDRVLKYWRKCKRNKIKFDETDCYNETYWRCGQEDKALIEIISRVAKDGEKATFEGIHRPMWERYRREWFEEMVRYGYSENEAFCWCFNEFYPKAEVVEKRLGRKLNEEEN